MHIFAALKNTGMDNRQSQMAQHHSPIDWDRLDALFAAVSEQMKETDRRMKETDKQMKETDKQMKETDKQMKETDRRLSRLMKETDKKMQDLALQMKESALRMEQSRKETDEQMKATDRKISNLSNQFVSQTGHIVEGLMEPSVFHALQEKGFGITQCCREMEGSNAAAGLNMEIDLFYMDTVEAIAVEVKTYCTKAKINHFLKQMQNFKEVFPKYADMKIYVAMAALKFDGEALQYAKEKGVLLIRAKKDLFSIEPFEKENLKTF